MLFIIIIILNVYKRPRMKCSFWTPKTQRPWKGASEYAESPCERKREHIRSKKGANIRLGNINKTTGERKHTISMVTSCQFSRSRENKKNMRS